MAETWTADIWFDPSCPLSRVTARWLAEAARVRPIAVRRHVMSLTILNEHRDDDPEGDPEGYLLIPARICAAVRSRYGSDALGRFHDALWSGEEHGEQDWIGAPEDALTAAVPRGRPRSGPVGCDRPDPRRGRPGRPQDRVLRPGDH